MGVTGIYVRDIFRAKNDEIQMFFLKDWRNTIFTIEIKVNEAWIPFKHQCYYAVCRGTNTYCAFMDHFGTVRIPEDFNEDFAIVRVNFKNQNKPLKRMLRILDVRPSGTYIHQLAVVLQPAYYVSDWQNVIQYFESWLSHGATKFYVYHYSWTKQVQQVIDFYQSTLGNGLEVLPWSAVPNFQHETGIFEKDPNTLIFNVMAEAALNNALYRSKNVAKYLAVMDLDELTVTFNTTLIDVLDEMQYNQSDIGFFNVEWTHHSPKIDLLKLDKPSDVNFSYLNSIEKVSNKSLPDGYFGTSKCIYRPDRIRLLDHHNPIILEWKDDNKTVGYYGVEINETDVVAVHLRRVFEPDCELEIVETSDILTEHGKEMEKGFKRRISGSHFAETSLSPWVIEHSTTFNTLNDCRRGYLKFPKNEALRNCRSVRGCEAHISNKSSFVIAAMSWTNIADPGSSETPL